MKLLIIGLDGATFKIIKTLIRKQKLPTISKLIENGVYGICKSTIPPVTSPAWPSFMTGCNPGKHGVYHFFDGLGKIYSFKDIKKPAFWEIIGDSGFSCIIVNVPVTYPPKKINGVIITGMLTPHGERFAYPREIEDMLKKESYIIYPSRELIKSLSFGDTYIDKLIKIERKRTESLIKIAKDWNFDVGCIVFQATDIVQHKLWNKKDKIFKTYIELDKEIDKLLKALKPENVIIISDHGFSDYRKQVNINQFLFVHGLLKRTKGGKDLTITKEIGRKESIIYSLISTFRNFMGSIGITQETVMNILPQVVINIIRKIVPVNLRRELLKSTEYKVDVTNSDAYTLSGFEMGVRINKNRVDNYEKFREELISKLERIIDPETKNSVFEWVGKREDIYSGEYVKNAPDIIFKLKDGYYPSASFGTDIVEKNDLWGHDYDGIFIGYGMAFKSDNAVIDTRLYDIAPTILYILRCKIPEYMDGKVITTALKPGYKPHESYKTDRERIKIKKKIKNLKGLGKI